MRNTRIVLSCIFLILFFSSCHSSSSGPAADGAGADPAKPAVEAIHNPEFRQQVKKEAVAEYVDSLHNDLNKSWVFAVRLFETDKTQSYRVHMRYEELEGDDTLKLPDLGIAPKPVLRAGSDKHSCMIGFMDNGNQYHEYKLVTAKGDQLAIHAVKHYSVSQGYRLVDLDK